ncbi:hypothetical protein K456DRAFT_45107, partial [Colletotrichum gloeosporioides 23]
MGISDRPGLGQGKGSRHGFKTRPPQKLLLLLLLMLLLLRCCTVPGVHPNPQEWELRIGFGVVAAGRRCPRDVFGLAGEL